jgi:hypothetical protein
MNQENHVKTLLSGMMLSTVSALAIFFLIKPFLLDMVSSALLELLLWIN